MRDADFIDDALDKMILKDPNLVTFRARDIAKTLKCSPSRASYLLQAHRYAQGMVGRPPRYIAVCRSYGRNAEWFIEARPTQSANGERKISLGHILYVARDAQRRIESDLRNELDPATMRHPVIQTLLRHAGDQLEQVANMLMASIVVTVETIKTTSKTIPDTRKVAMAPLPRPIVAATAKSATP